jgi:hypothetical protein
MPAANSKIRKKVFEVWGKQCWYCGESESKSNPMTVDHLVPLSNGGKNGQYNLRPACSHCNFAKAALGIEGFRRAVENKHRIDSVPSRHWRWVLGHLPTPVRFHYEIPLRYETKEKPKYCSMAGIGNYFYLTSV